MSKDFPIKDIINYENHIGWDLITPDGKYIRFSDNTEHKPFIYDEIKKILHNVKECCDITKDQNFVVYQRQDILKLLDYITNLQEENKKLNYCYSAMIRNFQLQTNIIDNLEKWLYDELNHKEYGRTYKRYIQVVIDKLNEMKENK